MRLWLPREGQAGRMNIRGSPACPHPLKREFQAAGAFFCTAQCAVVPCSFCFVLFSLKLCSQQQLPTALPPNPDFQHLCKAPSVKLGQNLPTIQAPARPPTSPKYLNLIFLGIQPKSTDQRREDHFSACLLLP